MTRVPRPEDLPPRTALTMIVKKLEAVGEGERVLIHGVFDEDEGCSITFAAPWDFAEGLRLGDKVKVERTGK